MSASLVCSQKIAIRMVLLDNVTIPHKLLLGSQQKISLHDRFLLKLEFRGGDFKVNSRL